MSPCGMEGVQEGEAALGMEPGAPCVLAGQTFYQLSRSPRQEGSVYTRNAKFSQLASLLQQTVSWSLDL